MIDLRHLPLEKRVEHYKAELNYYESRQERACQLVSKVYRQLLEATLAEMRVAH